MTINQPIFESRNEMKEYFTKKVAEANELNNPEPAPTKNQFPFVWDLVYADIIDRDKKGEEKYGTRLQAFNGRKTLKDAYQEALDLVVYLRQAIFEQDYKKTKEKLEKHEPDSLMCNCQLCKNFRERTENVLSEECESILAESMKGKTFLASNSKLTITPIPDEKCSCPGATEIYLAADNKFRCRSCEKLIRRNCEL